jgi:hypothetical protein
MSSFKPSPVQVTCSTSNPTSSERRNAPAKPRRNIAWSRAPARSGPQARHSLRTSVVVMAAARRDGLPCLRPMERLADRRMPGVEGMAGNATRTRNGGNATAQRRHRTAFPGRCQVSSHHLWCGRHGDETVPVAPGLVVREIGRISQQGRRGIRGVLVGLRPGERYCCARGGRLDASEAGELALARRGEGISHSAVYHAITTLLAC